MSTSARKAPKSQEATRQEQLPLFAPDLAGSPLAEETIIPDKPMHETEAESLEQDAKGSPSLSNEGCTEGDGELPPDEHFFVFPQQKLRESLEKCITYIFQHEGKPHLEEFWQLISLLCAKLYEERTPGLEETRFRATPTEGETDEGVQTLYQRVADLFRNARSAYPNAFAERELTLSPQSVAYLVNELKQYTISATLLDPFSAVYQQWTSVASRSSRGQFFSPLSAALYAIRLLDPQDHERVLDYTCGAGAFIAGLYAHRAEELGLTFAQGRPTAHSAEPKLARLQRYMQTKVFGAEIDSQLVEVARTQMAMTGGAPDHVYRLDSLAFPTGVHDDARAQETIPLSSLDAIVGNPPFDVLNTIDPTILKRFELAYRWTAQENGAFRRQDTLNKRVSLAVLFLERALAWLRPGGRLALVVPTGMLGIDRDRYARAWLLDRVRLQAVIELPIETFQAESGTHTGTSILLARKLTAIERQRNDNYRVFMAVVKSVGYDSRGRVRYKYDGVGEQILHGGCL